MSTPLKSVKSLVSFTKTTINRAMAEGENGGVFTNFLNAIGAYEADGDNSKLAVEQRVLKQIATQNILDNLEAYSGRYPEDREMQTKQVDATLGNLAKLDNLSLPDNHLSNAMYVALVSDIHHGIDTNGALRSGLEQLKADAEVYAAKSAPEYQNADISTIEKAALAVTSLRSWGNMLLNMDRGLTMCMDYLETQGTTTNGYDRIYYSENVLASLMKDHFNGDINSVIYAGKEDEYNLPSVSTLTGMTFNISSDIPKATTEDMYAVSKLFNEINDRVSSEEWGDKMKAAHPEMSDYALRDLRKTVSGMTESYNAMMVSNLPGYKRYYSMGVSNDNTNSL